MELVAALDMLSGYLSQILLSIYHTMMVESLPLVQNVVFVFIFTTFFLNSLPLHSRTLTFRRYSFASYHNTVKPFCEDSP